MLFVLWFLTKKLDFSLPKLIREILKEMGSVAQLQWTRASINGLLVIVLLILILLYFFVDRLKQAIEILHNLTHSSGASPIELVFAFFAVSVVGLLSLHSLPKT
jgi:hypothetical protein